MLIALGGAALLAGVAGAWSPCGFSMVDTLAPSGYAGRARTAVAASLAFAAGALAGGVATFGGAALLGDALGLGGGLAVGAAAAGLLVAALGDAAGRRIVPQVRRQVPESWRRRMPVALAAGLYGVLLGLGFTTFVLSFATWALAIACLALGDVVAGVTIGLAFGAGRAGPVVVRAPRRDRETGVRAAAAMAERPAILRGLRASAATALLAGAAALALDGAPADAAPRAAAAQAPLAVELFSREAGDPVASGPFLAWESLDGRALFRRGAEDPIELPGADPAVGGAFVAWRDDGQIIIARPDTLGRLAVVDAPGADALAISNTHLVWRAPNPGAGHRMLVLEFATRTTRSVVEAPLGSLGRPSLSGSRLAYHLVGRNTGSRLVTIELTTGQQSIVRRARRGAMLLNPTTDGDRLLYVRATARRQQLMAGLLGDERTDHSLYGIAPTVRRDSGIEAGRRRHREGYPGRRPPALPRRPRPGHTYTLWTTALAGTDAYVTRLRTPASGGGGALTTLMRIRLNVDPTPSRR